MADAFSLEALGLAVEKPSQMSLPKMIALYGKQGSGKTWLAASEALELQKQQSKKKVLLIDTEKSAVGTTFGLPDEYLDIISVTDPQQFDKLIYSLCTQPHDYATVIIDTFDVAHDRKANRLLSTHKNDKGQLDTRAAWGVLKKEQTAMLRMMKEADFRTILVVHETIDKSETGQRISEFAISGATGTVMTGIPDIIGLTKRGLYEEIDPDNVVTVVDFRPSDFAATKNRFSLNVMVNPTMSKLYETIQAKQTQKTETKKGDK